MCESKLNIVRHNTIIIDQQKKKKNVLLFNEAYQIKDFHREKSQKQLTIRIFKNKVFASSIKILFIQSIKISQIQGVLIMEFCNRLKKFK